MVEQRWPPQIAQSVQFSMTRRQGMVGVMVLLIVVSILATIALMLGPSTPDRPTLIYTAVGATMCWVVLLVAYLRGFEQARYVLVIVIVLLTGFSTNDPYLHQQPTLTLVIPSILALILAGPLTTLASGVVLLLILLMRAGWTGVYTDPFTLIIYATSVAGMIVARIVTDTAQNTVEKNAAQIAEQHSHLEQQARVLAATNDQLHAELTRQKHLLDLVASLETPVVQIAEGTLLAPLVGALDSRRAEEIMRHLLTEVTSQRSRLVIIDIAGVNTLDSTVAEILLRLTQALRLIGCQVSISGTTAASAIALTQVGATLGDIQTFRSPQEALVRAFGTG